MFKLKCLKFKVWAEGSSLNLKCEVQVFNVTSNSEFGVEFKFQKFPVANSKFFKFKLSIKVK